MYFVNQPVHVSGIFVAHHQEVYCIYTKTGRGQLKCDGTPTEIRFRLSAKRTSPFKSEWVGWASVRSTTGIRGVRISDSNAGYTMFRGSVKSTDYLLYSSVTPSLPPPVRHCVPTHFSWTLRVVIFS